jgi:hypothetical protein
VKKEGSVEGLSNRTGDGTGDRTGDGTGDRTGDRTGDGTGDRTGDRTGDGTGDRTYEAYLSSSWSMTWSISNAYENPEQPPPCTDTRRCRSGLLSFPCSCLIRCWRREREKELEDDLGGTTQARVSYLCTGGRDDECVVQVERRAEGPSEAASECRPARRRNQRSYCSP